MAATGFVMVLVALWLDYYAKHNEGNVEAYSQVAAVAALYTGAGLLLVSFVVWLFRTMP